MRQLFGTDGIRGTANTAPEQILAAHVTGTNVDMTRPLCPYPQVATYKGTGSTNDAASFTCKAP